MHASNKSTSGRRALRARDRRLTALRRRLRYLRFGAIGLFLAAVVVAFVLVLALPPNSEGAGEVHHLTRSVPQVTATIKSTQPPDILSAVRASAMYQQVYNAPQSLMGQALRADTLGTPVLVHTYHPTPGMTDVWVIPVVDATGKIAALLDYSYDAANNTIQPISFNGPFVPGDPNYNQPFPRQSPAAATAALSASFSAHGAAVPALGQPELVYFGADLTTVAGDHPSVSWTGGGEFPDLAVWIVPSGTQTYLVGLDDHVYNAAQLPLSPAASAP